MSPPQSLAILEAELDRLAAVLDSHPAAPLMEGPRHNVALLYVALAKQVLTQGRAALALLQSLAAESAIPNVRSLLEAFGELHYLHQCADKEYEALVAYYFAVLEVIATARNQGAEEASLRGFVDDLERIDVVAPGVGRAARARRNYWIPRKRGELVYEAFLTTRDPGKAETHPDYGKFIYKLLSWDGHHVTAMLSAVDSNPDSERYGMTTATHPWPNLDDLLALIAGASTRGVTERLEEYFRH